MHFPPTLSRSAVALAILLGSACGNAQPDFLAGVKPIVAAPTDPAIARALETIQPVNIEQTIKSLVGFGTRSTLSSMETNLPAGQGINAAADWISAQFERQR